MDFESAISFHFGTVPWLGSQQEKASGLQALLPVNTVPLNTGELEACAL